MKKRLVLFIEDLVKNVEKIERFVMSGSTTDYLFLDNAKDQFYQSLETIGESVKKLSSKIKKKYRDVSELVFQKLNLIKSFFEEKSLFQNSLGSFNKED